MIKREPSSHEFRPDYTVHPGEMVEEYLVGLEMAQKDLATRTGLTPKTINEIVKGKAPVTAETAVLFERTLGRPAHFWTSLQANYDADLVRLEETRKMDRSVEWLKRVPVREMVSLGCVPRTATKRECLDEVLSFFGIGSVEQWAAVWENYQPAFRRNQRFKKVPEAISAWLRKGEIESQKIHCEEFDRGGFRDRLADLRKLTLKSDPDEFVPVLKSTCASCGVAIVLVPEIKNTAVFGATRWLSPKRALIQLSLRYKTNDQLWFTFFHEAGHILLHGKKQVFIDSQEQMNIKEEKEADQFAADLLVPPRDYSKFLNNKPYSLEKILQFARHIGVAPGVVVGRLHHDRHLPFKIGQGLKIHYRWADSGTGN